jgi:hypothetical protein
MKAAAFTTLATLVLASACDIALLPETASYEGEATPRMEVVIAGDAMPTDMIEAVDLELVDVMLHRESDDAWVWVGGDGSRVELSAESVPGTSVPCLADHYDRMRVVIDEPRVAADGKWHKIVLDNDELELPIDIDLDADTRIELRFDVGASLHGKSAKEWRFDPQLRAEIVAE